jgi:hypothetical protein
MIEVVSQQEEWCCALGRVVTEHAGKLRGALSGLGIWCGKAVGKIIFHV